MKLRSVLEKCILNKCGFVLLLFLFATQGNAQDGPDPYAETGPNSIKKAIDPINIQSKEINVVSASLAETGSNFKTTVLNYMFQWIESEAPGPYIMKWKLESSEAENYEVIARVLGANLKGTLICNGKSQEFTNNKKDWSQIKLGTIALKKGLNTLQLEIKTDQKLKLSALELIGSRMPGTD